jgi:P-type Cu+ transporter
VEDNSENKKISSVKSLQISGMDCNHCASSIEHRLKQIGIPDARVDFASSMAFFDSPHQVPFEKIQKELHSLGYQAVLPVNSTEAQDSTLENKKYLSLELSLIISSIFTLPLLAHMLLPFSILHDKNFQLILCLPVLAIGILKFGRSALGSLMILRPNMDVLILGGALAAFLYSIIGHVLTLGHNFQFYETTASIFTFALLGKFLEQKSVKKTTSAIQELSSLQNTIARRVIIKENKETLESIESNLIQINDILLVNNGDKIPTDGEVIWGTGSTNEAAITGESMPVEKAIGSKVVGGTVLNFGSIKIRATAVGEKTVLSQIIRLVKEAQRNQPEIQRIGDKVSNIFVPFVSIFSLLTFFLNYLILGLSTGESLLRAVAVLVVACPCAMGLATPTAIMVAVGRAVKHGILIKGGATLEKLASVKTIAFDKTGTLTSGNFLVSKITPYYPSDSGLNENEIKEIILALEKHSSHPIAKSLVEQFKEARVINLSNFIEKSGSGISAKDENENQYFLGSYKTVRDIFTENLHDVYLTKNNKLIAGINLGDTLRETVPSIIKSLKALNINSALISGDSKEKCAEIAKQAGIEMVYSEQSPEQKLIAIEELSQNRALAYVGDGINDAPALAKANVGVSLSQASEVAIQSAQIILVGNKIENILDAVQISRKTLKTIKQNLFWAFFYNLLMLPIAAIGLLTPTVAAFSMAFSDVIVIGNSLRLKKVALSKKPPTTN